jgi:hypothetical protein
MGRAGVRICRQLLLPSKTAGSHIRKPVIMTFGWRIGCRPVDGTGGDLLQTVVGRLI